MQDRKNIVGLTTRFKEISRQVNRQCDLPFQTAYFSSRNYREKTVACDLRKARVNPRTRPSVVAAALGTLIHRYTGEDRILVGLVQNGMPGTENHWTADVLCFDFSGDPSVNELLNQSDAAWPSETAPDRDRTLAGFLRELKAIQDETPHFGEDRDKFFQVMLVWDRIRTSGDPIPSEPVLDELKRGTCMVLDIRQEPFRCAWTVNENLFTTDAVTRASGHLNRILDCFAAERTTSVSAFSILTPAEEKRLEEWNNTATTYDWETPLTRLFEDRVFRQPDRDAVFHEDVRLSYRQLNNWVNHLCRRLTDQGIGPEQPVGVLVGRGIETLAAILAIFKSGGVYVPLDLSCPDAYVADIVQQSRTRVIITQDDTAGRLNDTDAIRINADAPSDVDTDLPNPLPVATSENTAAILFTSGSTGKPKGVKIPRRQFINLFHWWWRSYPYTAHETACQRTTVNFLPSVWEFLSPVLKGIPLHIIPDRVVKDPHALVDMLAATGATRILVVPSLLKMLLSTSIDLEKKLPLLKLWVSCGERLPLELYQKFKQRMPHANIVIDYGSSEVNCVLSYDTHWYREDTAYVPIGRPVSNVQVYILDQYRQPVPVGVPGELHIGGVSLFREYLNQPGLTWEKLVDNPLKPGQRLYNTGDLAKFQENGTIECLGRRDHQVKIRGNKVDPGMVRAALLHHPEILEAEVVARRKKNGGNHLVAFAVSRTKKSLDQAELTAFLRTKLPPFMVPAVILTADQIPKTVNGKVDYQHLNQFESPNKGTDAGPEPQPRDDALYNEILLALTREIERCLEIDLSPEDRTRSFEEIGMNSVDAVTIIEALNDRFDMNLGVMAFFDYASISSLCAHIYEQQCTEPKAFPPARCPDQPLKGSGSHLEEKAGTDSARATERVTGGSGRQIRAVPDTPAKPPRIRHVPRTNGEAGQPVVEIAVIGMAGRFPGAKDLDAFWKNLSQGIDSVTEVPESRWSQARFFDPDPGKENRTMSKWGGFLDDIDRFDHAFFNIAPKEAKMMDPQQRICLEICWHALEDAGYPARALSGKSVGVFIGSRPGDYMNIIRGTGLPMDARMLMGNDTAMMSGRIAYALDLKGPNMTIDTACSSSLVAVHTACQSIRSGECGLALAGGVCINTAPEFFVLSSKMGMLSPNGRSAAFDAAADGFVIGEGVGFVALKSYNAALRDGDHIYGVIKGSGINQDGKTNGITAPSSLSQQALIESVYQCNGIDPSSIGYIEAHGTGTNLGDPIEIQALTRAFEKWTDTRGFCAIGSVKANIGHGIASSGIAGLIKVLLSMKHGEIPPMVHWKSANRHIDFENSPFYVPRKLVPWQTINGHSRRAAVSSFGFSGSNCHLVVEDGPAIHGLNGNSTRPWYLFPLSATTESALRERVSQLLGWLDTNQTAHDEGQLAHMLDIGRTHFDFRAAFVAKNFSDLGEKLNRFMSGTPSPDTRTGRISPDASPYTAMIRVVEQSLISGGRENLSQALGSVAGSAYKERLLALAELYALQQEWPGIYKPGSCHRIAVPLYPFERTRHWITQITSPPRPVTDAPDSGTLFEKVFAPTGFEIPDSADSSGAIPVLAHRVRLVMVNDDTIALGRHLLGDGESGILVRLGNDLSYKKAATGRYDMARTAASHAEALVDDVVTEHGKVGAVVDLSDLPLSGNTGPEICLGRGKLRLLQRLVQDAGQSPLPLFHFTLNLHPESGRPSSVTGSDTAGLITGIAAEYRHVLAKTIDLDSAALDSDQLAAILAYETTEQADAAQVAYRNGVRCEPRLKPLAPVPPSGICTGIEIDPEKIYIITGGTGSLGRFFAEYLINLGAKKLVLTGIRQLPVLEEWEDILSGDAPDPALREKLADLRQLSRRLDRMEIYTGPLTDATGLSGFINTLSREERIGGLIHAAGLLVTPESFVRKPVDAIQQVLEPKTDGLITLCNVLPSQHLDFFILFSSVSSAIPLLAGGLADYAAANSFMNQVAASSFFNDETIVKSILWPGWEGSSGNKIKNGIYEQLGFLMIGADQGIRLFEQAVAAKDKRVVLPCLLNKDLFNPEQVVKLNGKTPVSQLDPLPRQRSATVPEAVSAVLDWLTEIFSNELKIDKHKMAPDTPFEEFGMDSIFIAEITRQMESRVPIQLNPSAIIDYPTLRSLAEYLWDRYPSAFETLLAPEPRPTPEKKKKPAAPPASVSRMRSVSPRPNGSGGTRIAVIGMAGHFPEADDINALWTNLSSGKDSVTEVPPLRWHTADYFDPRGGDDKTYAKWGGFISGIELFDPEYFHFDPAAAPAIDPLVRLVLEESVHCLRDAGYDDKALWGENVGVFVGARASEYCRRITRRLEDTIFGTAQNFIAANVSHFFNFTGPNLVIDSACSSSLVSVHLACRSLLAGDADLALAGGVDILLDEKPYLILSRTKALSPDGRCRTFDENANGFVPGEGCGMVLLRPLEKALERGNRIYAVIEGSAVNNDGFTMGITTPSAERQKQVVRSAIARSGLSPEAIGYMEAHGTGTRIGDPIELKGLTEVFQEFTEKTQFCAIGSIKTNFGHLFSAAGIASFIKAALCLQHGKLVPTLHCTSPNPRFNFAESPFYISRGNDSWPSVNGLRCAGISSFGFGGTNAHMILSNGAAYMDDGYAPRKKQLPGPRFRKSRFWIDKTGPDAPVSHPSEEAEPAELLRLVIS